MVDEETENLIRDMDEENLFEMLEAEREDQQGRKRGVNALRAEKRLLDELGFFDIDFDDFDLSDKLERKILHLQHYNAESDVQPEILDSTKERMRELGLESTDSN